MISTFVIISFKITQLRRAEPDISSCTMICEEKNSSPYFRCFLIRSSICSGS
jgi:hypothetical protein